jgi:hypothetical protein
MNVQKIISELREERARLDEALVAFERLLFDRAPRRGRPPSRLKQNAAATKKKEEVAQGNAR